MHRPYHVALVRYDGVVVAEPSIVSIICGALLDASSWTGIYGSESWACSPNVALDVITSSPMRVAPYKLKCLWSLM